MIRITLFVCFLSVIEVKRYVIGLPLRKYWMDDYFNEEKLSYG